MVNYTEERINIAYQLTYQLFNMDLCSSFHTAKVERHALRKYTHLLNVFSVILCASLVLM